MFNLVNQPERIALARLVEFFADRKHWYRSLWGIGTTLSLEELFEACSVMRQGHLSEGSVKRIASSLQKRVGVHPGFTAEEKQFLREHLQQVPRAEGVGHLRYVSCRSGCRSTISLDGQRRLHGRIFVPSTSRATCAPIYSMRASRVSICESSSLARTTHLNLLR